MKQYYSDHKCNLKLIYHISMCFLVAALAFITTFCTNCTSAVPLPAQTSNNKGLIKLKFSSQGNISTDVVSDFIRLYAKNLEEKSGGQLKIDIYLGESLGKVDEEVKMLKVGISDIAFINAGAYVIDLPLSAIVELPFIVPTDRSLSFLNSVFSRYMIKDWTGMHVLFPVWVEGLDLFTTKKAVIAVEDLKNMDIRIPTSSTLKLVMTALGAMPVNIPPSETYRALEKGLVTGELSGFSQVLALKKYSISKYCTRLDYHCGIGAIAVNESRWNSLPGNIQKVFEDSSAWGQIQFNDKFNKYVQSAFSTFAEHGVEMNSLSTEEKARFYEITKTVSDKVIQEIDSRGLPGTALAKEMLNYRNSH